MPDFLSSLKKEELEKRLATLVEQYKAANVQLRSTLDAADQVVIKHKISLLEQEIKQIEDNLGETQDVEVLVLATLDDLPPISEVFIGRADEIFEFEQTLRLLIQPAATEQGVQPRRMILIRGEGGWGKSQLLRRYIEICKKYSEQIFWLYIDWEKVNISSHEGTPVMMQLLATKLQIKYGKRMAHFDAERKDILINKSKVDEKIQEIRVQFTGKSQEEFEQFLSVNLHPNEYEIHRRPQRQLSEALVADLLKVANDRPVILLFDTWEVVKQFADYWLTKGLIQFCLSSQKVGHRFLFVVAGRIEKEMEQNYADIVKLCSHERGMYSKELGNFTPGDVFMYFQEHPLVKSNAKQLVSREMAEQIHKLTHGIPLAVETVASMLDNRVEIESLLANNIKYAISEPEVIGLMVERFLRHLRTELERNRIYTFALMRRGQPTGDSIRQTKLLQQIWLRTRLIRSRDEFWSENQNLRSKYSFLFGGAVMHDDVYNFLRKFLSRNPSTVAMLCEKAVQFCEGQLDDCFKQLQKRVGDQLAETEKYRDIEWQDWLLDLLNYRLWLQEYDVVIKTIIGHYMSGMQYGVENFHHRLLSIIHKDPVFYNSLSPSRRSLLSRLANFKEWLGLPEMEKEIEELLAAQEGLSRFEWYLRAAEANVKKGYFDSAKKYLERGVSIYRLDEKNIQIENRIAQAYYRVGRSMSQSGRKGQTQIASWKVLEEACRWSPENPLIRCALAEALINIKRFGEAKIELEYTSSLIQIDTPQSIRKWIEKLQKRITLLESSKRFSPRKQAKISTDKANSLSAEGIFDEAERLYREAIELAPNHINTAIKYSHLLRQLGRVEEATNILARVDIDTTRDVRVKAAVLDAYGASFFAMADWDQSVQSYLQAIELSPEYLNAHYGLGRVYLRLEKAQEAMGKFETVWKLKQQKGISIRASLFWAWNGMGMANLLMGNLSGASDSFLFGEALCQRYLEYKSRQYQTWSQLGIARLGQNKIEEAREAFQEFTNFNIHQLRGFTQDVLTDIDLIGTHAKIKGWQEIYALLTNPRQI